MHIRFVALASVVHISEEIDSSISLSSLRASKVSYNFIYYSLFNGYTNNLEFFLILY